MPVHFINKDGTLLCKVDCYKNLNLLAHAQLEETETGSQCGGHGLCGKDRIQVTEGIDLLSPLTPAERKHLTEAEIMNHYRLACQCWPKADGLEISVVLGLFG